MSEKLAMIDEKDNRSERHRLLTQWNGIMAEMNAIEDEYSQLNKSINHQSSLSQHSEKDREISSAMLDRKRVLAHRWCQLLEETWDVDEGCLRLGLPLIPEW